MTQPVFPDKNVLVLYPTDFAGYRQRFDPLLPHFKGVFYFNYTSRYLDLGPAEAGREIDRLIRDNAVDMVLCCFFASDHFVPVEFLAALRGRVKVLFWFADDATYFEAYCRYYAQTADAVITADDFAVKAYERLEIPAVYCPEIVITNKLAPIEAEQDIDVLFVGDMAKSGRKEYLDHLKANGIEPVVFGFGSKNGYLPPDRISEYFCRSRIILNFCQLGEPNWITSDEPLLARVRQSTGRPREAALTRSFCLSEYTPSMGTSLEVGKETDVFKDKHELLAKVRYYLANPDRRREMAEAAYRRAEPAYRIPVYIEKTLKDAATVLAAGRGPNPGDGRVLLSPSFKAKAVNAVFFAACAMLARGNIRAAISTLPRLAGYGPAAFLRGVCGGLRRVAGLAAGRLAGKA